MECERLELLLSMKERANGYNLKFKLRKGKPATKGKPKDKISRLESEERIW
jgi:hypothetical protein